MLTNINASRHGAQNAHDEASKQTLDAEFGTSNEDECLVKILEKGSAQHTEVGPDASDILPTDHMADYLYISLASVKDPRTIVWDQCRLTEGESVRMTQSISSFQRSLRKSCV